MIVTKYFNHSRNWKDYERGSFKIGTLQEYRGDEDAVGNTSASEQHRMTDKEGNFDVTIGSKKLPGEKLISRDVQFGGIQILNSVIENVGGAAITFEQNFDAFIFCCSTGGYDPNNHAAIYANNPDLDSYAELDFEAFAIALSNWMYSHFDGEFLGYNVLSREVIYDDSGRSFLIDNSSNEYNLGLNFEDFLVSIFSKPSIYNHENEYRLVMTYKGSLELPNVSFAPFYPKSFALRNSIRNMGTISNTS